MSRVSLFALLSLAAPLAAAPVPKGPDAPDEPATYDTARFLKYRKVQKELKMTAEQRINLIDGLEDIEEDYEKRLLALDKMSNVPAEMYDKLDAERQKSLEKLVTTTADKHLTAAQRTRLRQLGWQILGPSAFTDKALQKLLKMTEAQKENAEELAEQVEGQADRYLDALGDDNEDKVKAEVVEFRKTEVKKFVESLKADQRELWKALVGEPVKGLNVDELWFKFIEDEELAVP